MDEKINQRTMKKYIIYSIAIVLLLATCTGNPDSSPSPNGSASGSDAGTGGSMARFTINGDYLYAVNETSLKIFDISDQSKPVYKNFVDLGFGIETVFPYKNNLFIGSQTGMYIYNIDIPASPQKLSHYQHVFSCDPVVANDKYAFVTLRTENQGRCWRGVNQLDVIDISDLRSPILIKSYQMVNPKGLGIDGNTLFICDDKLKVYDISTVTAINLKKEFNVKSYDVIPKNGNLFMIGDDGFVQYEYSNDTIKYLSSIKK